MQTQRYVLEQLLGMEPWRSPGSTEFRPTVLDRFSFSRPEGYEKVDTDPLDYDASLALTASAGTYGTIIGADPTGLATLNIDASTNVAVIRKLAELGIAAPGALNANTAYAHIAGFGAYADVDHMAGVDLDDDLVSNAGIVPLDEAFSLGEILESGASAAVEVNITGANAPAYADVACYDEQSDRWLIVRGSNLHFSNEQDYETWDDAPVALGASGPWNQIVATGVLTMLVGDSGLIRMLTWNGSTYTVATPTTGVGSSDLTGVAFGNGTWVATSDDGEDIFYSLDDGDTWNLCTGLDVNPFEDFSYQGVAFDANTGRFAASEHTPSRWPYQQSTRTSNNGVDWGDPGYRQAGGSTYRGIASNGQGVFVIVADQTATFSNGEARYSLDGGITWASVGMDRGWRTVVWNGYQFIATGYDAQFLAAGQGYGLGTSPDGINWTDRSERFDWGLEAYEPLAVGPGGTTIVWATDTTPTGPEGYLVFAGAAGASGDPDRLQPGAYEVIWLAVVTTAAGKVVLDHGTWRTTLAGGATGELTLTAPAAPAGLVGDLRYEIFMRYAPEIEDEATGQYTTEDITGREYVLAAVVDEGEEATITYPEVGRVLPDVGNVGMSAVDGLAAYHQDRVWFKPSRNEAAYSFVPDSEPAIDSLSRPMTLGFSELEYLNLTAESFYIHLPSGSSTQITGIISTPSGLMVFGENDAYIISGDPAIEGSLQVQVYPDAIGCDVGFEPVILGGRVFVLWRNRLHAIEGAQATDISRGVLDGQSDVRDVSVDALTNTILVMTGEGVLHFDLDVGEWYRSEVWRDSAASYAEIDYPADSALIPSPTGLHLFIGTGEVITYDGTEAITEPLVIEWRNVDAGDALRRDYWRYVRVPVDTEAGVFDVTGTAYLYYSIADADPDVATEDSGHQAVGRLVGEELVFRIPWGNTARRADFRLVITTEQRVAIQPKISFGYSAGPMGDLLP